MKKISICECSEADEIRVLTPKQNIYSLYSVEQISDIINYLKIHHEVPRQYNYFDKGAKSWDEYVKRLAIENAENTLRSTIELLRISESYIDSLLDDYSSVNIIDVGSGNAYPVRNILSSLLNSGKLNRYIALDISPSMLELAKNNIRTWFGDDVVFEGYEYDVTKGGFSSLIGGKHSNDINLILLLGGTLSNMRYPNKAYKAIHDSMSANDISIHVNKLDTEVNRKYFDFNMPDNMQLSPNHKLIFELLNIDETLYDVEMGYDAMIRERYIRVRLRVTIRIEFILKNEKRDVSIQKGDTILLWRGIHHTKDSIINQFDGNNFSLKRTYQTENQDYILTMSYIK
ncbi:MAG: hypothetical protein JWP06_598 [Candidatus Saccharibacteria bacterium]|nr:hypothetical protein [Candidatus Saccharibacteria bacterium]